MGIYPAELLHAGRECRLPRQHLKFQDTYLQLWLVSPESEKAATVAAEVAYHLIEIESSVPVQQR